MLAFLQALTISGMIGATFLIYQALGPRRQSLTYTREERREWDELVSKDLGTWLTVCNIFATITSLATVYVFFIGNTRPFGWWIIFPILTIWTGAFVTNYFTRKLISQAHLKNRVAADDQSLSVILSLFLDGTPQSVYATQLIRYLSLASIAAILWLEFSVFADISSRLVWPVDMSSRTAVPSSLLYNIALGTALIFACSFFVTFFTLKYGLRGFVFADLFHTPFIVMGTLGILIGAAWLLIEQLPSASSQNSLVTLLSLMMVEIIRPSITPVGGILFALSCVFLNSFLVLVTQPHWLRVWMFREKVIKLQIGSISLTCAIWILLVLIGLLASIVLTASGADDTRTFRGDEVVLKFLTQLTDISPLFAVSFWVAGMAALFSTADAQIYSFFLIERFSPNEAKIRNTDVSSLKPLLHSTAAAIVFSAFYAFVRVLEVPFDRLVLVLLPCCLNIVPALVLAARGMPQQPALILVSIFLYSVCGVLGLMEFPSAQMFAVAAPLMPVALAIIAALYKPREVHHATNGKHSRIAR
jgi:hypothetical protein